MLYCSYNNISIYSTLFTATEILAHMVSTFTEVEQKVLTPLLSDNKGLIGADDLLPMTIYLTIKARCALYKIKCNFILVCLVFHCLGLFYITCMILHLSGMRMVVITL